MKKRVMTSVLLLCLLFPLLAQPAAADCGPKPSIKITFQGLEGETYYVTLLSKAESTGPYSAGGDYDDYLGDRDIWEKFTGYQDTDGFYFLNYYEDCSQSNLFQWNYRPPDTFKILLYFPERDLFVSSGRAYSCYALDSCFTVDCRDLSMEDVAVGMDLRAARTYDYNWEILSLILRMALTIAIELLIALLFRYTAGKQLGVIVLTNIGTQILLNVALGLLGFRDGYSAYALRYLGLELGIFLLEGAVYRRTLHRYRPARKGHPWLYAFTANLLSFLTGVFLWFRFPDLF